MWTCCLLHGVRAGGCIVSLGRDEDPQIQPISFSWVFSGGKILDTPLWEDKKDHSPLPERRRSLISCPSSISSLWMSPQPCACTAVAALLAPYTHPVNVHHHLQLLLLGAVVLLSPSSLAEGHPEMLSTYMTDLSRIGVFGVNLKKVAHDHSLGMGHLEHS